MALATWWRGDAVPTLSLLSGFRVEASRDEHLIAHINQLAPNEVTMSLPKIVSVLATMLILISQLCTAVPARSASADRFPLEKELTPTFSRECAPLAFLALGVVRGKEVVYLKGYGIAGPDGRSVTPQTPFILGSTSKSFTALAIMQLVEAGKIDLDAPVTKYLPWFRTADKAASAQITVRRLLNQNSGLPVSEGLENLSENDQSDTALENGVRQLADVQLSHPAGQTFEYANENYTILGLIIIKRWQHRGELPLRRMRRFWRYVLPLGVDLCLATLAWPIVPRLVHAPMATISLFAPDVFLSIVLITSLGLGWALARTIVTFRPPVKTVIKKGESYAEVSGTA